MQVTTKIAPQWSDTKEVWQLFKWWQGSSAWYCGSFFWVSIQEGCNVDSFICIWMRAQNDLINQVLTRKTLSSIGMGSLWTSFTWNPWSSKSGIQVECHGCFRWDVPNLSEVSALPEAPGVPPDIAIHASLWLEWPICSGCSPRFRESD
jgi:hypothetical protein